MTKGVAAGAALLILTITGCVSTTKSTSAPSTSAGGVSSSAPAVALAAKLIVALNKVDPTIMANEARGLGRAKNTCADLAAGKPEASVLANVVARFGGGETQVDAAKAAKILAAVKSSGYCATL